jgi:hypothetical protein
LHQGASELRQARSESEKTGAAFGSRRQEEEVMKVLMLGGTPGGSKSRWRIAVAVSDRVGRTRASSEAEPTAIEKAGVDATAIAVIEV